MTTLYVGTSGFAYKEWKGSFYPPKLPNAEMLSYYAERLPAVEINNTFYRMPRREMLSGWADRVPEGFRFVLKASRRITHMQRLKDAGENVQFLLSQAAVLGDRLGPLLFQLPPFLKKDVERLAAFLPLIPKNRRAAFEFRNVTWFEDDVFALLREHNAALCFADTGGADDAPWTPTADWGYLRLRREAYGPNDLREYAQRIEREAWEDAFVFFKHEGEGAGPRLAVEFRQLF